FDCSETESLPDRNEEVLSKSPEIDRIAASGTLMKSKPSVPSPDLESALQATPGHKAARAWFKDSQLYKVAIMFGCAKNLQEISYSYLPLFLTDTLEFKKESIAYLPLVMLVGATVSTGITRKIIEKIGSKRSFILAGLVVIRSCVWFYFITQSTRVLTYPAAALLGFGFSAMFVNALSFATELIGDNKSNSGFVFSVFGVLTSLTGGALVSVIQNFFPEESDASEDCEECGDYVRLVFSIVPGLLAVISLLIVLMFDTSHNTTKRNGLKSDVATQTDASEEVS
ncbi:major facilitator superfamily domain-containing protein 12-like, partial [Oculina patagonica]